tara:strand:- start:22559 stop:24139 length:1581 start_codon:yes stop_codon:yes gene_type:complete
MATQQDYVLKFSADTGNVNSAIQDVQTGVEGTSGAVSGLTNQLDKMTGGAVSGFRNLTGGIKNGVTGLKSFKVALAATGIGAILVAIGTLITYFTSTKRGAEQLKVATAALGAAFDVLRDRVSKIGGALVKFFTGDFKGALDDVKSSFTGITDEIIRETKAASDLERAMNQLKDEEREFTKARAATNLEISKARLLAEDDTLTVEERIDALQRAVELEQKTVDEQLRLAEERARIAREQIALGESLEEDLQRVADAEAAVLDLQSASLRTQKRLQTELNSLRTEGIAKAKEAAQAEIDIMKATAEANTKRREEDTKTLQVTTENQEKTLQVSTTSLAEQVLGTETAEEEKRRLRRETFQDFKNGAELAGHQALEFAEMTLSFIGDLNTIFTQDEEKRAKRSFEIGKKLAIVTTIMNTAEAIGSALAKDATFPGSRFLAAAAAGAAGAAQVATISRQQFEAGVTGGTTSVNRPNLTEPPSPTAPQLDLGFLGAGAGQTGFRTYVVSSEVSNAQQANQRINDQATLVG